PPPAALPSFPTRRSSDLRDTAHPQLASFVLHRLFDRHRRCSAERKLQADHAVLRLLRVELRCVETDDATAVLELHPNQRDEHLRSEEHTSELQSPCNLVC